jgi:hypothetical protein
MQGHDPQSSPPRCVSCGATTLTPPTEIHGSPHHVHQRLVFRTADGDLTQYPRFVVDCARACLACGHVMLALTADVLADLRASLPGLTPARSDRS